MPETEAEQAKVMEEWGAWFAGMGDSLIDGGNPISKATTIASDGSTSPGGGSNPISGYSLITADDLDGAVAVGKGCPGLNNGGSVEVAETIDM